MFFGFHLFFKQCNLLVCFVFVSQCDRCVVLSLTTLCTVLCTCTCTYTVPSIIHVQCYGAWDWQKIQSHMCSIRLLTVVASSPIAAPGCLHCVNGATSARWLVTCGPLPLASSWCLARTAVVAVAVGCRFVVGRGEHHPRLATIH